MKNTVLSTSERSERSLHTWLSTQLLVEIESLRCAQYNPRYPPLRSSAIFAERRSHALIQPVPYIWLCGVVYVYSWRSDVARVIHSRQGTAPVCARFENRKRVCVLLGFRQAVWRVFGDSRREDRGKVKDPA